MDNIVYLNDDGMIVPPEFATKIIIRECDEKGNLTKETFMTKKDDSPVVEPDLTEDDIAFLKTFEKDGKKTFHL